MFKTIYNVYVSSVIFLFKNIYVVYPCFLVNAIYLFFGKLLSKETMVEYVAYALVLGLAICFTETYVIAVVYNWENKSHSSISPWAIVKEHYNQAVLLLLYFFLIEISFGVVVRLFSSQLGGFFNWAFFLLLFLGFFLLGLRHKIFYNTYTGSGIAGLRHLFRNILFYLVMGVAGIAILLLPVFLFPLSSQGKVVISVTGIIFDLFYVLIISMLYVFVSVSLTYAFLAKKR